ncbi:hypothetical protein [Acinetobacter sp. AR2-3]|uniref:hypothetical protein n=1 Tax=Acinetobacter sp. AR2-3 TaxID=1891969 RepID=UPI0009003DE4|nr:hypothetical protein [Acinetobacter sp. AR2-3]OIU84034.1 hypothetical protein BFN00_02345 [Acinetobacter sp. AR2-3]
MASKQSGQKKNAKAKFDSHQVTLTPYPPLSKIYNCYAQILKAAKLPSIYQPDIKLLYPSKISENEFFVLDNFLLLYTSKTQSLSINARYIVQTDIDLPLLKYQLSTRLFKLIMELKITINLIQPNSLLHALNTSLSKKAIYDLNALYHDKPRCELSLDLLAKIIGCSRNQLLHQQKKIHSSYTEKIQQLTEKCEALKHSEPSPNLFWRAQHAG